MTRRIRATDANVADYLQLFINRRAYLVQSLVPDRKGKHWYYRPRQKDERPLALNSETVRRHLEGRITISLYAINPQTQRCKWIAIDADYLNAVEDLVRLQDELKGDGVHAALEQSRRGGHLWLFGDRPLLAAHCRAYITHLAHRLKLPVRGSLSGDGQRRLKEGIEIFPKQDLLGPDAFGNAIRGPLGIHRTSNCRYWFYSVPCDLQHQLEFLKELPKITEEHLAQIVAALPPISSVPPLERVQASVNSLCRPYCGREFRILDYIRRSVRRGNNYYAQCPSCAQAGRDNGRDNLAISVKNPRLYKCWAGCDKYEIRSALGQPIRHRV